MSANDRIAIIGTADRQNELVATEFEKMKVTALCAIQELGYTPKDVVLVSGGAPWADHVAVSLFLDGKVSGLRLHLPGKLETGPKGPYITPLSDTTARDCVTFTSYHHRFKEVTGLDGLAQIQQAIDQGASVDMYPGYFKRNRAVAADCTALVALHTKRKHPSQQSSGGTVYTFKRARVPKLYIPFQDVRRKALDFDKLGYSDFEAIGIQNVFKRFKKHQGPLDAFFKRKAEDQADTVSNKRHKALST